MKRKSSKTDSAASFAGTLVDAAAIGRTRGVCSRTVLGWAAEGLIPVALRVKRVVRFDPVTVELALTEATKKSRK
jgi:hypothetical protein